ncbi:MAG: DUF6519 domain-containing protein [Pseudonocardiaceae bacterium]
MQADFSRRTFDRAKHFSAVLSQQGRVQLDADANEQAAILLYRLRTVIADLVGPAAAPESAAGFAIEPHFDTSQKLDDLRISPGRIYVHGILVENEQGAPADQNSWATYWNQPDGYLEPDAVADQLPQAVPFVVYLRVWERLITAVQDPAIREVALGDPGPDTAARSKVIWQVATHALTQARGGKTPTQQLTDWLNSLNPRPGVLAAQAKRPAHADEDPCHISPESRFRGPENQLYRVEVHSGGQAGTAQTGRTAATKASDAGSSALSGATFKWSRENASVVFPIVSMSGAEVEVATLGRDGKLGLEVGNWVEVVDDASASRVADDVLLAEVQKAAPALRQVVSIDPADRLVTLSGEATGDCGPGTRPELHPLLRRWDHRSPTTAGDRKIEIVDDGALPIVEGSWIDLEDGVQVRFQSSVAEESRTYRRGDYWLIPARTITGDVEWPNDHNGPVARKPHGVHYHYAPLAVIAAADSVTELRPTFKPLSSAGQVATVTKAENSEEAVGAPSTPTASTQPATAPSTRRSATAAKEKDEA